MSHTVFLDLDGVVADASGRAAELAGVELPTHGGWFVSRENEEEALRPAGGFWSLASYSFWRTIKTYPWSDAIVSMVDSRFPGRWKFLTRGSRDGSSYKAKHGWVAEHYPKHLDKLVMVTGDKSQCCGGSELAVLIDDYPKNCGLWRGYGGTAYHFEQIRRDAPEAFWSVELGFLERFLDPLRSSAAACNPQP